MARRQDDLAPLLASVASPGVGFRKGTVLSWDQTTAANTVQVGATTMTNLPILNTNEALLLAPGDAVGILTTGTGAQSWFIVGRITVPNTPAAASALAVVANATVAASDVSLGTRASATFGDLTGTAVGPAVTATIRSTGKALCFMSCEHGFTSTFEADTTASFSVEVSGATTIAATSSFGGFRLTSLGDQNSMQLQCAAFHLFTGLNPGSTTFTMKYRTLSGDTGDLDTVEFREREIAVLAL